MSRQARPPKPFRGPPPPVVHYNPDAFDAYLEQRDPDDCVCVKGGGPQLHPDDVFAHGPEVVTCQDCLEWMHA